MNLDILIFALPVAFAALGETISQRAGLINVGLEGQMLAASYFAFAAASATGNPFLGVGAGVFVALVLGAFSALFTITLRRDQVVVGTALNLLCLGATSTLHRAKMGSSQDLISTSLLPRWLGIDPMIAVLVVAVGGLSYLIHRSQWGLLARSAGEYPMAAHSAGWSIARIRWQAALLASLFAGLGGAYLVVGIAGTFTDNMSNGRGFVALAMVAFGRWKPFWVVLCCVFVGYLESLRFAVQSQGSTIPYPFLAAAPYLVALVVLVVSGRGALGPRALGQPFSAR